MVFQYIVYYIALPSTTPESTYRGRDEIGWVYLTSAGAYTATLYVMVLGWKGVGVLKSAIATLLHSVYHTILYYTSLFCVLYVIVLSDVRRPPRM